ncbi:hypothetical protein EMWEY_00046290, partial [Eimeria maxima]
MQARRRLSASGGEGGGGSEDIGLLEGVNEEGGGGEDRPKKAPVGPPKGPPKGAPQEGVKERGSSDTQLVAVGVPPPPSSPALTPPSSGRTDTLPGQQNAAPPTPTVGGNRDAGAVSPVSPPSPVQSTTGSMESSAGGRGTSTRKQRRKKKKAELINGPDPHTYRRELCTMLRMDATLQAWYALVVLYVAEWPTYARHGTGGDAYLSYLKDLAEKFEVPRHAAVQVQMLFAEELSCGTPSFFLDGLKIVGKDIHRHHDLIMVLRKYREDSDFADLIDYTQVTKLPADVSISGFPMILRTAFEGFAFCFSKNLYIRPDKKGDGQSRRTEGT